MAAWGAWLPGSGTGPGLTQVEGMAHQGCADARHEEHAWHRHGAEQGAVSSNSGKRKECALSYHTALVAQRPRTKPFPPAEHRGLRRVGTRREWEPAGVGTRRESSSTARLSAAQSRRLAYVRRLSNKGVVFVLAQPWNGHLADKYQVMKQGKIDQRQNLCAGKMRLVIAVVHVPENILLHLCKS